MVLYPDWNTPQAGFDRVVEDFNNFDRTTKASQTKKSPAVSTGLFYENTI
jgi:hypothetical protein